MTLLAPARRVRRQSALTTRTQRELSQTRTNRSRRKVRGIKHTPTRSNRTRPRRRPPLSATPDARPPASEFPPLGERLSEILRSSSSSRWRVRPWSCCSVRSCSSTSCWIPPTAPPDHARGRPTRCRGRPARGVICLVASPYLLVRHISNTATPTGTASRASTGSTNATPSVSAWPRARTHGLLHGPAGPATTHLHSGPSQPVRR